MNTVFKRVFEPVKPHKKGTTIEYSINAGNLSLKWAGIPPTVSQVLKGFYETLDSMTGEFPARVYDATDTLRVNETIYHRENPYGTTTWKIKIGQGIPSTFAGQEITLQKGKVLSKESWGKVYPLVALIALLEEADFEGSEW